MRLSEYIAEAIAKRSIGKYGFPHDNMDVAGLNKLLSDLDYTEKPNVRGSLAKDYRRADYIGQNCYFTYTDYYSTDIVVTSENDTEHALAFSIAPYGAIDYLFILGGNGKAIEGDSSFSVEKDREGFIRVVTKFLGIK
jgi:hypothetical protein